MSPLPIIQRQRALSQVGEIRCGGEKKQNAPGQKLESFRLTSQHKEILETAAVLWGGEVKPWESPSGPAHQLYTDKSSLPCMVIVGYSLNRVYELWEGATKCTRRCDGLEEQLSGKPCLCNAEGSDLCDTITRLMVMLPDTGTSLGWKLRSTGEIAADELDGAMMVAEKLASGRAFVPAVLRLTQRRSVSGGQTKRWVTPVLDFNLGEMVTQIALPAPAAGEITGGYTPLAAVLGVTVDEALDVVNGAASRTRSGRGQQVGDPIDDFSEAQAPAPDEGDTSDGNVTPDQKRALNALHGELVRDQAITTDQVYAATATMRSIPVDDMIVVLEGRKQNGDLSFAKLRDSLTKVEASSLIDRLGRLADNVKAGAAA